MAAVFALFLITGMALPVLPLHLHQNLGQSTFVVGLVAGAQFAASLASRVWAGSFSDRNGVKTAVLIGLALAVVSGAIYLLSLAFSSAPAVAVAILLVGRALLGAGESFVIVGAQSWALTLAGDKYAGKAIAWIGTAMYAALALGAPLGSALFAAWGFVTVGLATLLIPLVAALTILPLPPGATTPQAERTLRPVIRAVWLPGIGLSFSSLGFGVMTAFSVLLFVERGWHPAWLAFTVFAVAFIAARLVLGHLSDQLGGARVALVFSAIEGVGLAVMAISPWPAMGLVGAALTGLGCSLVYPALGLEAVRRTPPGTQGLAMGVYTAFLDLALGILSPLIGLLAVGVGLGPVFLVSAVLIACAMPIALLLRP